MKGKFDSFEEYEENSCVKQALNWHPSDKIDDFVPENVDLKGGQKLPFQLFPSFPQTFKSIFSVLSPPLDCEFTPLHRVLNSTVFNPILLLRAGIIGNPRERMRLVVTEVVAGLGLRDLDVRVVRSETGETLYGEMESGEEMYAEQGSNGVIYVDVIGPQEVYRISGYSQITLKSHLNSFTVTPKQVRNSGKRTYSFSDGHQITHNFPTFHYHHTLSSHPKCELTGSITFSDPLNHLACEVNIGLNTLKRSDYVEGVITEGDKGIISTLTGSYLSWLEWDEVRYYDVREADSIPRVRHM